MAQWSIVMICVAYVLFLTVGVGYVMQKMQRGKTGESFHFADRSLTPWVGGATIALAAVGAIHCVGLMESGATMGMMSLWMVLSAGAVCAVEGVYFAPLYRKMGVTTIPQTIEKMFNTNAKLVASVVTMILMFSFLGIELQGGGILISQLTGVDPKISIALFMVFAATYCLISGMWQVAWLNFINVAFMYIIMIITFGYILAGLPNGLAGVQAFYAEKGLIDMLNIWPPDLATWLILPIPTAIGVLMMNPMDQGKMSYYLAAKDTKGAVKMGFIATLFNSPFGTFPVVLGIIAVTYPAFAAAGPKFAALNMINANVPTVIIGLLLASFVCIVLSTFARFAMGISTLIIHDFYLPLSKNPNKEKNVLWLSRVLIIGSGLLAMIPAFAMPHIVAQAVFCFGIIAPNFFCFLLGLYWKRNSVAAICTLIMSTIVTFAWEYSSIPKVLGVPEWFGPMYAAIVTCLVVYIGLTLVLPNSKKAYLSQLKKMEKPAEVVA